MFYSTECLGRGDTLKGRRGSDVTGVGIGMKESWAYEDRGSGRKDCLMGFLSGVAGLAG